MRRWQPSVLPRTTAGQLHVRTAGSGDHTTVLLHGLVATGDIFGRHFDALADDSTVVVPDLLGFGRSLDERRDSFTPKDHLDALDSALDELGLSDQPITIGAHSMGSALALRWLERRSEQITSIACFGPPIYPDANAVAATIASAGPMAQAFVANTKWAKRACHINCAHRRPAGITAGLVTPSLPWPISTAASLHTWPAYRDAMDLLIEDTDWHHLSRLASEQDVPFSAVWGSRDRIGSRSYAATLSGMTIVEVEDAGHHLPLTHPELCVEILRFGPHTA